MFGLLYFLVGLFVQKLLQCFFFQAFHQFLDTDDLCDADTEVIINITGSRDGAVSYDYSGIFYMRAKDADQYWERPPYRGNARPLPTMTYKSVGNEHE